MSKPSGPIYRSCSIKLSQFSNAIIETKRLRLRSFEMADAPTVQKLAGVHEVSRFTANVPHPYEDGMAQGWIGTHEAAFKAGLQVNFAIIARKTNELIGAVSLIRHQGESEADLGYWLGVPFWGQGLMSEAAAAAIEWGFREWNLEHIHARHLKVNPASGRVMQKIGMSFEGEAQRHIEDEELGDEYNLNIYGISRKAWQELQKK